MSDLGCPWCDGEPTGVELPWAYDGILYWYCPDCTTAWSTWPPGHPKHETARRYIGEYRRGVETARNAKRGPFSGN